MNEYAASCLLIHAGVPTQSCGLNSLYVYMMSKNVKTHLLRIYGDSITTITEILARFDHVRLIGMSIHWHPQIAVSLKLMEIIKSLPNFRNSKIAAGGMTASYFADDLIEYPFLDFVIKGDAEVPFYQLYQSILNERRDLSAIPNLYWKKRHVPIINRRKYCSSRAGISSLEREIIRNRDLFRQARYVLNSGRGCKMNCLYCGGSRDSFKIWGNGCRVMQRSVKDLRFSLDEVLKSSQPVLYLLNDYDGTFKFLSHVLSEYDLSKFHSLTLDSYGLPSIKNLVRCFARTHDYRKMDFKLEISPESGDEKVRRAVKTYSFRNSELERFLDFYFRRFPSFKINLFFSYYHPSPDFDNLITREYIVRLTERYLAQVLNQRMFIYFLPLSTDPGSAIQRKSVDGLQTDLEKFSDYYTYSLKTLYSTGNFLHHRPTGLDRPEFILLTQFFRFENLLRRRYPLLLLSLVRLFDQFADYNRFMRDKFLFFHEHFLKPMFESNICALSYSDYHASLFGYHFQTDETVPSRHLVRTWLSFLKTEIRSERKILGGHDGTPRDRLISKNRFMKLDRKGLLRNVIESVDLAVSEETFSIVKDDRIGLYYKDLLQCNYYKILSLLGARVETVSLLPFKANFCWLTELAYSDFDISPFDKFQAVALLGKRYFRDLLKRSRLTCLPSDYRHYITSRLDTKGELVTSEAELLWNLIVTKKDNSICDIVTNIFLMNFVPQKDILERLGITHTQTSMRKPPACDPDTLSLSKFYGQYSRSCDIRLINFYINYLKRSLSPNSTPVRKKRGTQILMYSLYYPEDIPNSTPMVITEKLTYIEKRVLEQCDGNTSLYELYRVFSDGRRTQRNAFRDLMVYFYSLQVLF